MTVFRVRELLLRQRTQTINVLRGHLTEFGKIVPQGARNALRLTKLVEADDNALPDAVRATLQFLVDVLRHFNKRIAGLDAMIARRAREDDLAWRLMTIPGIIPLIATALATLAPPADTCWRVRDFAAWLVLTLPIFFPVVLELGIDPIWFGVLVLLTLEMGRACHRWGSMSSS